MNTVEQDRYSKHPSAFANSMPRVLKVLIVALLIAFGLGARPAQAVQVLSSGSQTPVAGATNSWFDGAIYVQPGTRELRVSLGGGWGDADIYVRRGLLPTTSQHDYHSWNNSNQESIVVTNPADGWWYISVHGYVAFSGATLRVSTVMRQAPDVRITVRWRWERRYDGTYQVRTWITNNSAVSIRFDDFANVRINSATRRVLANLVDPEIRPGQTHEETIVFVPSLAGRRGQSVLLRFDILIWVQGESYRASNFGSRRSLP